jgi:hypothetical protein
MLVPNLGIEASGLDEADLQPAAGLAEASKHGVVARYHALLGMSQMFCHYIRTQRGPCSSCSR